MPFPETPLPPVIVPAAPDARLVGFSLDADGGVIDWTMTIIAWRIVLDADGLIDEVEPVCAETLPEVWCLRECHDGVSVWRFPEDRDCDALATARQHAAATLSARMRGVRHDFGPSRIKGKRSLVARLRRLTIAAYRFGAHRAATHEDRQFAAQLFDGLKATLNNIEVSDDPGGGRSDVLDNVARERGPGSNALARFQKVVGRRHRTGRNQKSVGFSHRGAFPKCASVGLEGVPRTDFPAYGSGEVFGRRPVRARSADGET